MTPRGILTKEQKERQLATMRSLDYRKKKSEGTKKMWKEKDMTERNKKVSLSRMGEKHPLWKGDKVSYTSLHEWINNRLKKPTQCLFCCDTNYAEYANLLHDIYTRNLDDYIPLCKQCHKVFDNLFKKMEKNVVTILSGGLDSTTLVYFLHKQGFNIKALSFNYGQRHKKELQFAAETCKKLSVEHHIIDLSSITKLISNSALTGDAQVPHGHYEDESMKITVVPNRNAIMLSIAVGYAENLNYKYVAIGNHKGDRSIYPDCRREFIDAMNEASQLGTYNKISIFSPFCDITKTDIARIGLYLGIDYDKDTWSCYEGGEKPCNLCGTCNERNESIMLAKQQLKLK